MKIDLRKAVLQIAEQFLVPFQFERGMHAALHEDLIAAQGDGLFDLLVKFLARQHVGLGVVALAVKRAEIADRGAHVRVVNIAVDVIGAVRFRMQSSRHGMSSPAERA